jgi:hypothetical protein
MADANRRRKCVIGLHPLASQPNAANLARKIDGLSGPSFLDAFGFQNLLPFELAR